MNCKTKQDFISYFVSNWYLKNLVSRDDEKLILGMMMTPTDGDFDDDNNGDVCDDDDDDVNEYDHDHDEMMILILIIMVMMMMRLLRDRQRLTSCAFILYRNNIWLKGFFFRVIFVGIIATL